jgi:hypothetical protein
MVVMIPDPPLDFHGSPGEQAVYEGFAAWHVVHGRFVDHAWISDSFARQRPPIVEATPSSSPRAR